MCPDDRVRPHDRVRGALALTDRLLRRARVDTGTYRRATAALSTAGVVEVVALVGYYALLAGLLRTFDVAQPDDALAAFDTMGRLPSDVRI